MSKPNQQAFIGRENEMKALQDAWLRISSGSTSIFVVRGDSGVGKTRLIQQFYSWMSTKNDDESYWPGSLPTDEKSVVVVPDAGELAVIDLSQLPWLWFAIRCRKKQSGARLMDLNDLRPQLAVHLANLIQREKKKSQNSALAKSLVGAVANFAVPGSSGIVELVNTILKSAGASLSLLDVFNQVQDRVSTTSHEKVDQLFSPVQSAEKSFMEAFGVLCGGRAGNRKIPTTLVIDDAQWLDPGTIDVLRSLTSTASSSQWPLLILINCWDESVRYQGVESYNPELSTFLSWAREHSAETDLLFYELALQPLDPEELQRIVNARLPNLGTEATKLLVDRSSGDIDLLNDFLDEMTDGLGWIDSNGQLDVGTDALLKLPSQAGEMARKRLRTIGRDIRAVLTCASAQGIEFDQVLTRSLADAWGVIDRVDEHLTDSDQTYGITSLKDHPTLIRQGEFRRRPYFEACNDFFRRHPKARHVMKLLLDELVDFMDGHSFSRLDTSSKERLATRTLDLIRNLGLDSPGWQNTYVSVADQLSRVKLMNGDLAGAAEMADKIVKNDASSREQKVRAWNTLVQSSYAAGHQAMEQKRLEKWASSQEGDDPSFYIMSAYNQMRRSEPEKAVRLSEQALQAAGNRKQEVEASVALAVTSWSNGNPERAYELIKQLEQSATDIFSDSPAARANVDHAACLVLHDLDRSRDLISYGRRSIQAWEDKGNHLQTLIAKVNLGDALWAIGVPSKALSVIRDAYVESAETSLVHARDIAAICLANVLASEGSYEEASELYEEGLSLAEEIGHSWDLEYGRIYSMLCHSNMEPRASAEDIKATLAKAQTSGHDYIKALAQSLGIASFINVDDHSSAIELSTEVLASGEASRFPIAKAHALAAQIITSTPGESPDLVDRFINGIAQCQGIHGSRNLIKDAVSKVRKSYRLSPIETEFLNRWVNRFLLHADNIVEGPCFKTCDYTKCEARCCYDGAYLTNAEVVGIKDLVSENKDFFDHLPGKFIVDGEWGPVKGKKTAVRDHQYQSPDYPSHFNETRCVFAFEDGSCSLQIYSEKFTDHAWTHKPRTCCAHPLSLDEGKPSPPPARDEVDRFDYGLSYPGYVSYTPCGQPRADGTFWKEAFSDEIDHLTR
jgi:tetratricopeptide (TPR) repeat protein/GTPase SAR1 family protein